MNNESTFNDYVEMELRAIAYGYAKNKIKELVKNSEIYCTDNSLLFVEHGKVRFSGDKNRNNSLQGEWLKYYNEKLHELRTKIAEKIVESL